MLVGIIEGATHADLDAVGGINEAFFQSAAEGGSMIITLTEHLIAQVRVGVKVDHGHRAILLGHSSQLSQGDRVVAAQNNGQSTVVEDAGNAGFNGRISGMDVAGNNGEIPQIAPGERIHDVDLLNHVVRLHHAGDVADSGGAETGAGAERTGGVKRSAGNGKVHTLGRVDSGHAHKGTHVAETGR